MIAHDVTERVAGMTTPAGAPGPPPIDPSPILRLATGYWDSFCLLTANRLGIFPALASGPRGAESLAQELGFDARALGLLLKALAALGFLRTDARGFTNAPVAQTFLVPGTPAYLGNALRYGDDMAPAWLRLGDAVRDGRPQTEPADYLGRDEARTRRFVRAMHERALGPGRVLVSLVDLTGRKTLLDVGGGPGTYAALFTQRWPGLRAEVIELPAIAALAGEILRELGAEERVRVHAGDHHTTPFPGDRDVVLVSGVLHREREAGARALIRRGVEALAPGGLLALSDVFADAGGASPPFAALFGLNMLLSAEDGGVHADADVAGWMAEAGLADVRITPFPPPMPHRVIVGRRP
jgi:SAM-dependent methyltransferase